MLYEEKSGNPAETNRIGSSVETLTAFRMCANQKNGWQWTKIVALWPSKQEWFVETSIKLSNP
jgi:hypothetical protein